MAVMRLLRRVPPYTLALVIAYVAVALSLWIDTRQDQTRTANERVARIDAVVEARVAACLESNETRRLVSSAVVRYAETNAETNAEALLALYPTIPSGMIEGYVHNVRIDAMSVAALFPRIDCEGVALDARVSAITVEE